MNNRFESFTAAIFEISRCWHKLVAKEMNKFGLRGPYAVYLLTLAGHPEGLTAGQLCDLCHRDKSDVSRAMMAMKAETLIFRSGTGYRAKIPVTEKGLAAAEQVSARADQAVEIGGRDLSEEERTVFYQALQQIADNLLELTQNGFPEENE